MSGPGTPPDGTGLDYESLTRELLLRRLRAAELVCVLAAWAPANKPDPRAAYELEPEFPHPAECAAAANMALAAWRRQVGPEVVDPVTRGEIVGLVDVLARGWRAIEDAEPGDDAGGAR